jgi:hypothetical protein
MLSIGTSPKTFNTLKDFAPSEKNSCFAQNFKLLISKITC